VATHEVLNQVPPLENLDLFGSDRAYASAAGSPEMVRASFLANDHPPVLHTHDARGFRRDEVEFHPSYHAWMRLAIEHGMHSLPWSAGEGHPAHGRHVARAALLYLGMQVEAGHTCPVSMTYASIPTLRKNAALAEAWEPLIIARDYDPAFRPAPEKAGLTIGMAMTEKQGGSDVRANTTRAVPLDGEEYSITGHKWFCSAPMSDAFLVLAQANGGLTCFFLPRWRPDGSRNAFFLQRLKPKLGNRSNASSEVEFDGAWAVRIGEEGRGVSSIIDMVQHTRLDCVLGSAGLMRAALRQALHHTAHRMAFGKRLAEQPLMRSVLADLIVETHAATWMALRLAAAFDRPQEAALARIAAAVSKFWVCKRAPQMVAEALECLGGNGYVETSVMPRLYREAPLLSIWEGSGNVIALDVLRAVSREPESLRALMDEIALARGMEERFDRHLTATEVLVSREIEPAWARRAVEWLALALQASLLLRFAKPPLAEAFCRSRLDGSCLTLGAAAAPPGVIECEQPV
jgi:putative acyl-CoA dehydrogenase